MRKGVCSVLALIISHCRHGASSTATKPYPFHCGSQSLPPTPSEQRMHASAQLRAAHEKRCEEVILLQSTKTSLSHGQLPPELSV